MTARSPTTLAAKMAAPQDREEYTELAADSDSDDNIPLADLLPLRRANVDNNHGSTENESIADNLDEEVDLATENVNMGVNNGHADLADVAANLDLSSAMCHEWLEQFDKQQGHMLGAGNFTELQVFNSIFTRDVLELLVTETNRYATQYFEVHPKDSLPKYSLYRMWVPVSMDEMAAFMGTLYFMGYMKLPTYYSYWSTDFLTEMRGFRTIISRNRWHLIWNFFHVTNNEDAHPRDHPQYDKLFKIRPLVDILINNWQSSYYPGQNLSVDESIVAYKGRASMIQYNPNKPHKWGMKAWVLSESKTGYIYNWDLYKGGTAGRTEAGLTQKVVLDITKPVYGHRHHIYMDNFFSSPDLFAVLAENKLGACGTLRVNRRGVPPKIKESQNKLSREDPPVFVREEKFLYIAWQDKKTVNLISTIHNDEIFERTVRCRDAANDFQRKIIKPKAIELYNQHMGGVDLSDQKMQVYLNVHRTLKWWKKVALYLFEASFVNTFVIWKSLHEGERIRVDRFRLALIHQLIGEHRRQQAPARQLCNPPGRFTGAHFVGIIPGKTPKGKQSYSDCAVCSNRAVKRHQTEYICKTCQTPLHPYPCFERYHTLIDYKIKCSKELHST